jgi:PIN domain nuclease of toxin-antitoxin system
LISINDFPKLLAENQFGILPLDFKYYNILVELPFHHQDPFDRMLISQAMCEDIPIITNDAKIALYDVKIIRV